MLGTSACLPVWLAPELLEGGLRYSVQIRNFHYRYMYVMCWTSTSASENNILIIIIILALKFDARARMKSPGADESANVDQGRNPETSCHPGLTQSKSESK